mgnify:CR=1 FL=1
MKLKICHYSFGIIASIAVIVFLLITAFEIGAYSDYGWFEKEYAKYEVLDDLEMKMKDVMHVTEEMMAFLRGNRTDLVVDTVVDGEEREFFNDREKAHMVDVKNLFVGGLWVRRIAILLFMVAVISLIITKADWKRLLPKSFLIGLGVFVGVTTGMGLLFLSDFNKYFTMFHELFFDNDLWLLDPRTDLLIRMLPEGFFMDMVIRIGLIFIALLLIGVVISIVALHVQRNKKN